MFGFSADEKCRFLILVVISVLGSCLFHFSRTVHAVYEDCDPLGHVSLAIFVCFLFCFFAANMSWYLLTYGANGRVFTHIVAHSV